MMIRYLILFAFSVAIVAGSARLAFSHGTPIEVGAAGGALTVGGGLTDTQGFVSHIFMEDDEEGDPFGEVTLANAGPIVRWTVPGFAISGLNDTASLSMEVVARPVQDSSPPEERIVWFWSANQEEVLPAPADMYLLGTGQRFATLPANEAIPPPAFLLTASLAGQQNPHNHNLLSYGLDNDAPRPAGAYGFFVRLVSSEYAASDPFLIVLNYGVDYELMPSAAIAINAAAIAAETLPGDFNDDGIVDSADYVAWRKDNSLGSFAVWRQVFDGIAGGGGNGESSEHGSVPEPSVIAAAIVGSIALASYCLRSSRS